MYDVRICFDGKKWRAPVLTKNAGESRTVTNVFNRLRREGYMDYTTKRMVKKRDFADVK